MGYKFALVIAGLLIASGVTAFMLGGPGVVIGVVLVIPGALLALLGLTVLRNPDAAIDRLTARREELKTRAKSYDQP